MKQTASPGRSAVALDSIQRRSQTFGKRGKGRAKSDKRSRSQVKHNLKEYR